MPNSGLGTRETILVVDNDQAVLTVVVALLKSAGFQVLQSQSGAEALKLAEEQPGEIDLLLSAVELPHMSGPELGMALKVTRPAVHVMLMSGQEEGNLLVLNYGWAYIQKELVAVKLVEMVTDVLHSQDRSQLGDEFDRSKDKFRMAV